MKKITFLAVGLLFIAGAALGVWFTIGKQSAAQSYSPSLTTQRGALLPTSTITKDLAGHLISLRTRIQEQHCMEKLLVATESCQKLISQHDSLHARYQHQSDSLVVRSSLEREGAIVAIKKFRHNPELVVEYQYSAPSAYNSDRLTEIYTDQEWQYEVLAENNTIIQAGPRPRALGEPVLPSFDDQLMRYSQADLQHKAQSFISEVAPEVRVEQLKFQIDSKEDRNYFFRYEDMNRLVEGAHPFIQVGFSRTGELLSYTNTLRL